MERMVIIESNIKEIKPFGEGKIVKINMDREKNGEHEVKWKDCIRRNRMHG